MKKNGFSSLAIIVVVGVTAVVALGVYLVLRGGKLQNQQTNGINQYQQTQQDPFANWKTYTSNNFGFEIKYPNDWQVSSSPENRIVFSAPFTQTQFYNVNIDVEQNTQNLDAKSWVDKLLADNAKENSLPAGRRGKITFKNFQNTNIAGIPAYGLDGVFAYDVNQEWIFVPANGYIFKFYFPTGEENPNLTDPVNNNKKARDMLSTFKLIQPQPFQPGQGK